MEHLIIQRTLQTPNSLSKMSMRTFVQQIRVFNPRPTASLVSRPYSMIPSIPHTSTTATANPISSHSDMHAMYNTEKDEGHSNTYVTTEHHVVDDNSTFSPSVNAVFDD
ncbi:hypothetical protein VKS41_004560 [Umbelopsis sp. WA50703]|jgi:hypothetical protein